MITDMLKRSLKPPRYGYRRITILLREDRSQRCVLSKAPVPSALLKTRKSVVKYSHNGWTKEWGQTRGNQGGRDC
ncbi:MAG: hypothetical protein ACYS3S_08115 [Planctomycetota bacterium]